MENILTTVAEIVSDPRHADNMARVSSLAVTPISEFASRGATDMGNGNWECEGVVIRLLHSGCREVEYLDSNIIYGVYQEPDKTLYRIGDEEGLNWISLIVSEDETNRRLTVYLDEQFLNVTPSHAVWEIDAGRLSIQNGPRGRSATASGFQLSHNATSILAESAFSPFQTDPPLDIVQELGSVLTGEPRGSNVQ